MSREKGISIFFFFFWEVGRKVGVGAIMSKNSNFYKLVKPINVASQLGLTSEFGLPISSSTGVCTWDFNQTKGPLYSVV